MRKSPITKGLVWVSLICLLHAQQPAPVSATPQAGAAPPGSQAPKPEPPKPEAAKPQAPPAQSSPAAPQATAQPAPAQTQQQPPAAPPTTPAPPAQGSAAGPVLNLQNASLTDVIDILARHLKINYILDPRVKGTVTLNTYGEVRHVDVRPLLETILRMNGCAIVQVGELYRIVPLADVSRLPVTPEVDAKTFPPDERMMLNLVFLKYATVTELAKLLEPFLGEGARMTAYEPANLLLLLDNSRNMKRTMELVALFDNDTLASQRVRLFETKHGRPSDIAKELESILKSMSLSDKTASVKFMPVDRINTLIAVAPNPGVFQQVETWLAKLDVPVKTTAGATDNYVYRVKYARAETLAGAIMQLYLGIHFGYGMGGFGFGFPGYGMGFGGYGSGFGMGFGGYGSGMGYGGGMYGGMGMPYGGMGMYGGGGYGMIPGAPYGGLAPGYSTTPVPYVPPVQQTTTGPVTTSPSTTTAGQQDLTGSYLGAGRSGASMRIPQVVPNPFDNTLLIQATPQEYQQILKLLDQLDLPPRQVLIEAKIYEVNLQGAFASGVQAFLQKRGLAGDKVPSLPTRMLQAASTGTGLTLTAGALVGESRELLAFLTAQEDLRRAKIISAPTVIATDSIPAVLNVGTEVPTLSAQAVSPIQSGGTSLFTNSIQNRSTGVTLNILARVNPSGIVTLVINQEVSAPIAPAANSSIQSPSFSKRFVQTQVTVQDGDLIAIGGIITESETNSSAGVPLLHRIPIVGAAFGSKSISKERTELVVFMRPRVIYDTNQITEASDEIKASLKRLQKLIKE